MSGNAFYGAYGWWRTTNTSGKYDQAVDFYVVENYGEYYLKDKLTRKGAITSNNAEYDIYIGNIENQGSFMKNRKV